LQRLQHAPRGRELARYRSHLSGRARTAVHDGYGEGRFSVCS
jgi:hypothetical protein